MVAADQPSELPTPAEGHPNGDPPRGQVRAIAFYVPRFHPTDQTDAWFGPGFTDWRLVAQARPWFDQHRQPRLPADLGFTDLREPATRQAQIGLARDHGLHGFCLAYYWFAGRRLFDRVLADTLADPAIDLPFCLCWLNRTITGAGSGDAPGQVLLEQVHDFDSDVAFIRDVLPALRDPRYIRHRGAPVLLVQHPERLARPILTTRAWRRICRENGIDAIHLCAVENAGQDARDADPRRLGFDAAVELPPVLRPTATGAGPAAGLSGMVAEFEGTIGDYQDLVAASISRPAPAWPLHRGVAAGWDDTPHRAAGARIFRNATPEAYGHWLRELHRRAAATEQEELIFINAWNDWANGATLEPDLDHGRAWLLATARALAGGSAAADSLADAAALTKIVFVGHGGEPSGAALLGLAIVRDLAARPDHEVTILLLAGGDLVEAYRRVATTHVLSDGLDGPNGWRRLIRHLAGRGYRRALCSTSQTGTLAVLLAESGFAVLGLIHEMPDWLTRYNLTESARLLAASVTRTVFPSADSRRRFCDSFLVAPGKPAILPQGIYLSPPADATRSQARAWVGGELGISDKQRIVMGCGATDLTKGADLFIRLARHFLSRPGGEKTHFVWVGHAAQDLVFYLKLDIARLGLAGSVTFTDARPMADVALFFAAADVFALTSRIDSFPSAVLEAMQAGTPVVAFEQATGSVDLIRGTAGMIVPYGDTAAMATAIGELLTDRPRYAAIARQGCVAARLDYDFPAYVAGLLRLFETSGSDDPAPAPPERAGISAVLPDGDPDTATRHTLLARLDAIARQTRRPAEIIIVGLVPTTAEQAKLDAFAARSAITVRCAAGPPGNRRFARWQTGIEHAVDELVWLVEAGTDFTDTLLADVTSAFADPGVVLISGTGPQRPDGLADPAAAGLFAFRRSALGPWQHRIGAFHAAGDWFAAAALQPCGRTFRYGRAGTVLPPPPDPARLLEGIAIQAETIAANPHERHIFSRALHAITHCADPAGDLVRFFYRRLVDAFDRAAGPANAGALLTSRLNILVVTGDRGNEGATRNAIKLARVLAGHHSLFLCAAERPPGSTWPEGIVEDGIVLAEARDRDDEPAERLARLRHFVASHDIHIVHSHDWRADLLSYQMVAGTGTPWLISAHGESYPAPPPDAAARLFLPGVMNRADGLHLSPGTRIDTGTLAALREAVPRVAFADDPAQEDEPKVSPRHAGEIGDLYRRTIAMATTGGELWRSPAARTFNLLRGLAAAGNDSGSARRS